MRDPNVFGIRKALPRMSWSPRNLYNLYNRSFGEMKDEALFTATGKTLFQQRWKSKQLTRAYHGDFINEKIFKRWYLPSTLPDVRPHGRKPIGDDTEALNKWSLREKHAAREKARRAEEERMSQAPVASLMYEEVERRIDVFIFRCCFAHSVYEARRLVIHGRVLLNGRKHTDANTRIAPGDMVSVDPKAISFLRHPPESQENPYEDDQKGEDNSVKKISIAKKETSNASETALEAPEDLSKTSEVSISESSTSQSPTPTIAIPTPASHRILTPLHLPPYAAPFIFIPAYIEVSFATCSAVFVRRPTARYMYSEIPSPYDADGEIMRLSWEWYNKVRPRMRSQSQLARMPNNRKESRRIPGVKDKPPKHLPPPTQTTLKAQIARNSVY
ncbi:hypothetical protein EW145_g3683 [Phellinidium pouzarii]|uniref:RNA-binding S4 domain-containing protein n=1 Tax=Phellinidium pouzarii TaxID=167371 RepID=A0A4S4L684_9AGAM|nr:hypothetical protein EW145_g3683 [Phellinidium pouzarii]